MHAGQGGIGVAVEQRVSIRDHRNGMALSTQEIMATQKHFELVQQFSWPHQAGVAM
jgi:hypothetical protein